jgi:hypothetical protein
MPVTTVPSKVPVGDKLTLASGYFAQQLDELSEQLKSEGTLERIQEVARTGVVACAGYVFLHTRAGYLLLSLITARPLWSRFDPLVVLIDWEEEEKKKKRRPENEDGDDDTEETLQSMIEGNRSRVREEEKTSHVSAQPRAHESNHLPPVRRPRARATARPRGRRTQGAKGPQ